MLVDDTTDKTAPKRLLQAAIEEDGYVVAPLLDPEVVAEMRAFYATLDLSGVAGNYCSIHEPDEALKLRIRERIRPELERALGETDLEQTVVMGGVFVVKGPTEDPVVSHQDPTFVAEPEARTLNIWIPLQDVDASNGCLWILPRSQDDGVNIRPGNGYDFPSPYDALPRDLLWAAMTPLEMNAGEALIYDHRMLHGSQGNATAEDRLAIVSALCRPDAELFFYHAESGEDGLVLAEYEMSLEDYLTFKDFVPERGANTRRIPVEPAAMSVAAFLHRYGPVDWEPPADVVDPAADRAPEVPSTGSTPPRAEPVPATSTEPAARLGSTRRGLWKRLRSLRSGT